MIGFNDYLGEPSKAETKKDCFDPEANDCVNCWNGFPHTCPKDENLKKGIENQIQKVKEVGHKAIENAYQKGFADGEKNGREDAAHDIISLLDKWGERTKAMNPDIAIGYQNAIGVIRIEYLKENNRENE